MELNEEITAKLIERAKLYKDLGADAAEIVPKLLSYIGVMKTRLDAAMKREEEWKAKVESAKASLQENARLKKQMAEMLDHPEVRAAKAAQLKQQIELLNREKAKLEPEQKPE